MATLIEKTQDGTLGVFLAFTSVAQKRTQKMNAELIARLEAAEVGSDDLDVEIATVMRSVVPKYVNYDPELWCERNGLLTTSISAAESLVDHVFPEWMWRIGVYKGDGESAFAELAPLDLFLRDEVMDHGGSCAVARTPALAMCSAILRALDAQEQK